MKVGGEIKIKYRGIILYGSALSFVDPNMARYYPDYNCNFIFFTFSPDNVSGLSQGTDYIDLNGEIWLSQQYLNSLSNVSASTSGQRIDVYVSDQGANEIVFGPGGTGVAALSEYNYSAPNECSSNCDYTVFFIGGMIADGGYFNHAEDEIIEYYRQELGTTTNVKTIQIFPYGQIDVGDFDTPSIVAVALIQAYWVGTNMIDSAAMTSSYEHVKAKVDEHASGDIVLIGHSGGGIASARAGELLQAANTDYLQVVQVGSPRMYMSSDLRATVAFIYAKHKLFTLGDPITRIGEFANLTEIGEPHVRKEVQLNPTYGNTGRDLHIGYFVNAEWDNNTQNNFTNILNTIWSYIH